MSKYIHKSHNVSVIMYHIVCPSKYRKVVFDDVVEKELKDVCLEIADRYEIEFLEMTTTIHDPLAMSIGNMVSGYCYLQLIKQLGK